MSKFLEPGKYVVAVSGGVDSVVLLDMLSKEPDLKLVVAHFDHGIRNESSEDAEFVEKLASKYNLEFYSKREELGADASEETARTQRYKFLNSVLKESAYDAIVTAHHQDDLIETALLNVLRGTKHKGLISLKSTASLKRPLLEFSKNQLIEYAYKNNLNWREDASNQDTKYRRNKIRKLIKNSLTQQNRQDIINLLRDIEVKTNEIDQIINNYLSESNDYLDRSQLNKLDESTAGEIVAAWLRKNRVAFDKSTIKRVVNGSRQLENGSKIDIKDNYFCLLEREQIVLNKR